MGTNTGEGGDRDKRGRFSKGISGNPNGRPRKQEIAYDQAETFVFANTLVNVNASGSKSWMRRIEANRNKLFACAMKGEVRAQIYLDRLFAAEQKDRARVAQRYDQMLQRYYCGDFQGEIPLADELFMQRARAYLHIPDPEPPTQEDFDRMREHLRAPKAEAEKTRANAPKRSGVQVDSREEI